MIDTGLLVVVTITFVMLLTVTILLFYDFEEWCPQVYSALFNNSVKFTTFSDLSFVSPISPGGGLILCLKHTLFVIWN